MGRDPTRLGSILMNSGILEDLGIEAASTILFSDP